MASRGKSGRVRTVGWGRTRWLLLGKLNFGFRRDAEVGLGPVGELVLELTGNGAIEHAPGPVAAQGGGSVDACLVAQVEQVLHGVDAGIAHAGGDGAVECIGHGLAGLLVGVHNTDMVVKANRLPVPGETILGGTFYMNPGGKGANQAIAAARLGAEVTFISKIGYDLFGLQALEIYRSEKINTEFIFTDQKSPSGVALISVDSFGENSIIVAPGASRSLSTEDINKAEEKIKEADIILMQLEVPIDTVEYAATIANRYGKKVILNPAPASTLSNSFLNNVHTILPNRIEAEMLSGIKVMDVESAHRAAKAIGEKGIENVVITLGKDGAYVKEKDEYTMIPAKEVETIDTTGAGDVFCGAFSVYLSQGHSLAESVKFANAAAAIAVTRIGAQSAIPYKREVNL